MFKLLDWWKNYRLEIIAAKSAAQNAQFLAMQKMVEAQMSTINQWFTGFQTYEVPKSTTVREIDEWNDEQNRLHPGVQRSIENAIKAGTFPELKDILT